VDVEGVTWRLSEITGGQGKVVVVVEQGALVVVADEQVRGEVMVFQW